MEWIIGVVIVFFIFYFMSRGEPKASSGKRANAINVKDYVQNDKIYTKEDAARTVHQFVVAMGYPEIAENVANNFLDLLEELKKEYRRELIEVEESISETNRFYEEEIEGIKSNPDYDKDLRKEELSDSKVSWKDDLKDDRQAARWYEKQISGIDENPKQLLRKALQSIKRQDKETDSVPQLTVTEFLKYLKL
jgi:hypothetical protein